MAAIASSMALSAPRAVKLPRSSSRGSSGRAPAPSRGRNGLVVVGNKDFASEVGTLTLTSDQIAGDRYIASNRFNIQKGAGPKFEKRWAERKSRLADLEGFRFFTLLRRVVEEGEVPADEPDYVSFTVWEDKKTFNAWRTGEAFKEAHGGGTIFGFVGMLVTSLRILKGGPKPAFFDAILPVVTDPASNGLPFTSVGGWRDVPADGVNFLPTECYVAMNRFAIAEGKEGAFEQRWAARESKLKECDGFCNFFMLRRDAPEADDGYNYVSLTVWKDRASFDGWREGQAFKQAHGEGKPAGGPPPAAGAKPAGPPGGAMDMFLKPPAVAFYEGKLVLQSQIGA